MGQFLAGGRKPTGTAEATLAIQRRSAGDQRPAGRPESPICRHQEPILLIIGHCPRPFASVFLIWENYPTAGSAHRQVFHQPAHQVVAEDDGDEAQLEDQVTRMKNKWSSFHRQVDETRKKIDLSVDYFTLVEGVEQSFRQGGQLLLLHYVTLCDIHECYSEYIEYNNNGLLSSRPGNCVEEGGNY